MARQETKRHVDSTRTHHRWPRSHLARGRVVFHGRVRPTRQVLPDSFRPYAHRPVSSCQIRSVSSALAHNWSHDRSDGKQRSNENTSKGSRRRV
eukprot:3431749-Rhodomonas_salina.1